MNDSILIQLLDLLKKNKIHTKEEAAALLNVTDGTISMMIEQLLRSGYLDEINSSQPGYLCVECAFSTSNASGCSLCGRQGRAFLLTNKALHALQTAQENK